MLNLPLINHCIVYKNVLIALFSTIQGAFAELEVFFLSISFYCFKQTTIYHNQKVDQTSKGWYIGLTDNRGLYSAYRSATEERR